MQKVSSSAPVLRTATERGFIEFLLPGEFQRQILISELNLWKLDV